MRGARVPLSIQAPSSTTWFPNNTTKVVYSPENVNSRLVQNSGHTGISPKTGVSRQQKKAVDHDKESGFVPCAEFLPLALNVSASNNPPTCITFCGFLSSASFECRGPPESARGGAKRRGVRSPSDLGRVSEGTDQAHHWYSDHWSAIITVGGGFVVYLGMYVCDFNLEDNLDDGEDILLSTTLFQRPSAPHGLHMTLRGLQWIPSVGSNLH
ncbi:2434_t:CDS:2 [Acaulospora colombiana]|uniref:2434_t:CDS:1 n=1 Tax=Acaulospora colombiana TaxID=27376 RepID=A0ACA9N7P4_9GLOM|nr:2434_t:CDS:2 [Acaulospora colombiana]